MARLSCWFLFENLKLKICKSLLTTLKCSKIWMGWWGAAFLSTGTKLKIYARFTFLTYFWSPLKEFFGHFIVYLPLKRTSHPTSYDSSMKNLPWRHHINKRKTKSWMNIFFSIFNQHHQHNFVSVHAASKHVYIHV